MAAEIRLCNAPCSLSDMSVSQTYKALAIYFAIKLFVFVKKKINIERYFLSHFTPHLSASFCCVAPALSIVSFHSQI